MECSFSKAALRCRCLVGGDWNRDGCGWKAISGGGEGDVAFGCGGAEDGEGVAVVEFPFGCLEGVVVQEVAIVYCDDFAGA